MHRAWRVAIPIEEFAESISQRELLVRLAHLGMQWNKPDRGDHYLMRFMAEMVAVASGESVHPKKFQIPFVDIDDSQETDEDDEPEITPEQAATLRRTGLAANVLVKYETRLRLIEEEQYGI